jgi:energy-converting hydrogenase B subunit D
MFWVIDYGCVAGILVCGLLVVRLRNLNGAVMALSGMGTIMSLLFVVLGAPDDAHSEVVVGAIALPTVYFIAIAKLRASLAEPAHLGEEGGDHGG